MVSIITQCEFMIKNYHLSIYTGWIRDYYQSYPVCLHAQNILVGIVIIMWSIEIVLKRYNTSQPKLNQRPVDI